SWYVLNHIGGSFHSTAQKTVDKFNERNDKNLELFAPTYVVKEEKGGEIRFKTAKLTFHYVFLYGILDDIKELCRQVNGFSFLIDRGNAERYAIVDDKTMANFKNIARAYKNCLPYFSLDDIELEDGDLVEVVKGDFPGLVGTYMPNAKSKTGNIVLQIFNNVGTIAFNVKVSDVRVLEFSRNSTRANDQIDAFLPNLLKALRYFNRNEALPTPLAAKLAVFRGRMEVVRLNNRKLDARLQVLLYATSIITGYEDAAIAAKERYDKVKDSVTNEWTKLANNLILAIISDDTNLLKQNYNTLATLDVTSKMQHIVKDEYEYYMTTVN
ncbi:MAG: hypothetical protein K2F80_08780, partial [Muribaculaceae bacterium]|nr:hypothetical protein [Muribaculaceae bacterium]